MSCLSLFFAIVLGILFTAPIPIAANTEKIIFTAYISDNTFALRTLSAWSIHKGWPSLIGPRTLLYNESLLTLSNKEACLDRCQNWYILEGLSEDTAYEVRVSYSATNPTDFSLTTFTPSEAFAILSRDSAFQTFVTSLDDSLTELQNQPSTQTYLLITGIHTGVPHDNTHTNIKVHYNLALERLYFNAIPTMVYKLSLAIVVVIGGATWIIIPRAMKMVRDVVENEIKKRK